MSIIEKIFGTHSERELKRIEPIVKKIEGYREEMGKLTDDELRAKTAEFKKRVAEGTSLDEILPEAYAVVREGAKRVLNHYPSSRSYCRDENRRRKDTNGTSSRLFECA